IVAPSVPLMSARATFTMLVSSTAMIVPIMTDPAISHLCGGSRWSTATGAGCGGGAGVSRGTVAVAMERLTGFHVCVDRHARSKRTICATPVHDLNPHRNTLNDLREVARRIVRRQQR